MTYTSLGQIGLVGGCTLAEVASALSNGCTLSTLNAATSDYVTGLPSNYGMLLVQRVNGAEYTYVTYVDVITGDVYVKSNKEIYTNGWGNPIATATTPTEYELELADDITSNGLCTYTKTQEGIVILNMDFSGTFTSNILISLGTLPSGFRPSDTIRGVATFGHAVQGRLYISSGGSVAVAPETDITTAVGGVSVSFVAAN